MGSRHEPAAAAVYVVDAYHEKALETLQQASRDRDFTLVLPHDPRSHEFLQNATAVLVRSETKLTADVLRRAGPQLRYIIKQGVGVDNIDLGAARERGIQVFNTPGLNSEAVAELTLSLALCVARRVSEIDRMVRGGERVVRSQMLGKSLFQKTIGIIGMGNIGREVAVKWQAMTNGRIVAFDPYAKEDAWAKAEEEGFQKGVLSRVSQLDALLQQADVVTIHVPLTPSTHNLISASQLQRMKPGAILLNCARGGIVDERALLDALNSGHLFGAALDAVEHEPPTLQQYGASLLAHPRVVLTPHIGASTVDNQERSGVAAARIVLDLLDEALAEKPQSLV